MTNTFKGFTEGLQNKNYQEQHRNLSYAKLLLYVYKSRPKSETSITLNEYFTTYGNNFEKPHNPHSKLDKNRLTTKYCELKERLNSKLEECKESLRIKTCNIKAPYKQITDLIYQKQKARLDNLQCNLKEMGDSKQNQQLARIKKVISNGAWGCLDRLHQKLAKLKQLQISDN